MLHLPAVYTAERDNVDMKATCCFQPLDIFRLCANQRRLHQEEAGKTALRSYSFKTLQFTSSPHFHLKLSAEAGAMFVSALILLLASFLRKRLFQTGTAQRRGEAPAPAVTDRGRRRSDVKLRGPQYMEDFRP